VGGETGFPESVLDAVREAPGVDVAVPRVDAPAYVVGSAGEVLTVIGVDITEERRVRRYETAEEDAVIDDPLVFLSQPNSIVLTRNFAARHGLELDSRIELATPSGKRSFVVRGLLAPRGPAVAFGGDLAVMDYQAAQVAFGKGLRLDGIDVVAVPGQDLEALAATLRSASEPV
jgi:ABC-type lipoprotein release transport system permease subunit